MEKPVEMRVSYSASVREILSPLAKPTNLLALLALASLATPSMGQSVSLSATNLSFGSQVVGTASLSKRVVLTNTGSAQLAISGMVASASFSQANTCGATLPAGAKCSISVTFTPPTTGVITGSLIITDNASDSPQTIILMGTGVMPVSLSPPSMKFAGRTVGTTSAPIAFTLQNNLSTAVTISSIQVTGDYAQTNNCGGTLGSKTKCTVSVTFTPTVVGTRAGVLTVSDSASNSPQISTVSGSGSTSGLVSIAVTPVNPAIAQAWTQQFQATGTFNTGFTYDLTQSVNWSSSKANVATVNNAAGSKGLANALAVGATSIRAAVGAIQGLTTLTVNASLVSISIAPAAATVAVGTSQQYTATGQNSDGSTQNLTNNVIWNSTAPNVATITGSGLMTAVGSGSTTITASWGTIAGATSLSVNPVLVSLAISPANPSIAPNATQQFKATGTYSDGSTPDLTNTVTWASSNPGVATISNTVGSQGLASALSAGSTTISATSGATAGSTTLATAAVNTPCSGPCILTYHNDLARDGVVGNESTLTPANVNSASFGRVATITGLNGQIYAQPLYMSGLYNMSSSGNVIFLATQQNYVYAFDADTYRQVWGGSYLPPGESPVPTGAGQDMTCTNINPDIGITGTPVIDPNPNFNPNPVIYFVTKSVDENKNYHQRLHAVDAVSGLELFGGPVEITTPAGSSATFDPLYNNQRSGLALTYDANQNPQIYIAWGSHCDIGSYRGLMMEFTVTAGTLNSTPAAYFVTTQGNGLGGGIWMSGGAPAADSSVDGNIYLAVGNGTYDGIVNFGQSAIKFNSDLQVVDWYTPNEWVCLNGIQTDSNCPQDSDLGSGGVVLFNVPNGVPEFVAAGKQGEIYVIYQSNLGHLDPLEPPDDYDPPPDCTTGPPLPLGGASNIAQCFPGIVSPNNGGSRSTPAFWNGTLYTAGTGDALRAFTLDTTNIGTFNPNGAVASTPAAFPYPGSATVISWNGTDPSTGILWTLQTSGAHVPVLSDVLRAYVAVPDGSSLDLLYQSTTGPGAIKFQVPTIANGKVYVGGQGFSGTGTEGQLYVFGLCPCN